MKFNVLGFSKQKEGDNYSYCKGGEGHGRNIDNLHKGFCFMAGNLKCVSPGNFNRVCVCVCVTYQRGARKIFLQVFEIFKYIILIISIIK